MKKLLILSITLLFLLPSVFAAKITVSISMKYRLYNRKDAEYRSVIISEDFLIENDDEADEKEETIYFNADTKYKDASFDPVGTFYLFSVFSDKPIVLDSLHIEEEKPLVAHYTFSLLDNGEISYEFQDSMKIRMIGIPEVLLREINKYFDQFEG